jgi:hypothetical protein
MMRWVAFPLIVFGLFIGLVLANLNGSSIGLLGSDAGSDPQLLMGSPRSIRSDEYVIATPLAISSARQGFPSRPYVGLTSTEQEAIAHGAPTKSWFSVFKPQDWGYLLLGPHRGLAAHWWFPTLASLVGVFLLLRTLSVDAWVSGALAVVAAMSPYNAWWSSPAPGLVVGYGALTGAALVAAFKSSNSRSSFAWGAAAGVAGIAMFLTLYPPWQLTVGAVIVALACGYALDQAIGWRRFGLALSGLFAVAVPGIASWYFANADAVAAIMGTYYPGHRTSAPGEATLAWLLDAPLNPLLAGSVGSSVSQAKSAVPYTNLSELSASWLPLPILGMATLGVVVRVLWPQACDALEDRPGKPMFWTAIGLALVFCVLLAWGVLPLPEWTGTILLERVPGRRLPLALGLASVLLVAVSGSALRRQRWSLWVSILWLAAIALTVGSTMWSADRMPWDEERVAMTTVFVLGLVVATGFGLVASGLLRHAGALLLACFAAWSWALVNPLYRGLGPLDHDPVVRALRPVALADPGARVLVFADTKIVALVRASGVQTLSGVTFYPDEGLMQELVPDQRNLWNNYANYRWVASSDSRRAFIRQMKGTSMELHIYPCARKVLELGPKWAVSDARLDGSCLRLLSVISRKSASLYFYQINP